MMLFSKFTATTCLIAASSLTFAITPMFAHKTLTTSTPSESASLVIAYSAADDAYDSCVNELASYGVTVTDLLESYSGKGGATVVLAGVNEGGVSVTARCTLTLPSRELDIEYL